MTESRNRSVVAVVSRAQNLGLGALKADAPMGYSILALGDVVRISAGAYEGAVGVVESPALEAEPYETERQPTAMLFPVTVSICIEGAPHTVRVPADLLTRVSDCCP